MGNYVNTFRIDNMKYQLDGELCKHIPNRQHEIPIRWGTMQAHSEQQKQHQLNIKYQLQGIDNKRQRKPKGQSRMENQHWVHKTQDKDDKHNTNTQHKKLKR